MLRPKDVGPKDGGGLSDYPVSWEGSGSRFISLRVLRYPHSQQLPWGAKEVFHGDMGWCLIVFVFGLDRYLVWLKILHDIKYVFRFQGRLVVHSFKRSRRGWQRGWGTTQSPPENCCILRC
jgi:hypothetical protein